MTFARAALCLWLLVVAGCSSSEDGNAGDDAGGDASFDRCGAQSYCCKNGESVLATCLADGAGACPDEWTYCSYDCNIQPACRHQDDVGTDTPCDAGKACCCDIDVAVAPTCIDSGLTCAFPYRLVLDCATCLLYPDGEPAPDSVAETETDARGPTSDADADAE